MKNVNDILTLQYFTLLDNAVNVPVFRTKVIEDVALGSDAYLLISGISNNDSSTFQTSDTDTSIQVSIYTRNDDGSLVQSLANTVYQTIQPGTMPAFTISGFQLLTTELVNDIEQSPFIADQQTFLNRTITFKHKIFHQ